MTADNHAPQFEFDLALSFLGSDEPLAQHLANVLRERMSVFIYSEQQKELAGKDGLEMFTRVFGQKARVCAVLYRQGWGETPWTRVEATAIKDRAMDNGWDFLTFISLDGSAPPAWLPKTKLWLGLKRYGVEGAAAVLDARVRDEGGDPHPQTAREIAETMGVRLEQEEKRRQFLHSLAGVKAATAEVNALFQYLENEAAAIAKAGALAIQTQRSPREPTFAVSSPFASFTLGWTLQYANVVDGAGLYACEYSGFRSLGGNGRGKRVAEETYSYSRTLDGAPIWQLYSGNRPEFSTKALAEHYLQRLLKRADSERERPSRATDL